MYEEYSIVELRDYIEYKKYDLKSRSKSVLAEKIYKKESLNYYNPDTSANRLDIRKALRECISKWPLDRQSEINKCYEYIWDNSEINCDTAQDLIQAASGYVEYHQNINTEKQFYPNFYKWLGTWESYKGKSANDIKIANEGESYIDRLRREQKEQEALNA